ncbi:putative ribonuclease H-like domain-containing protein [Tanacetum coccineum]
MAEEQCDDLIVKLNQTEFTAATYKRGLATVEEQLITYRKNEVLFSEEVAVLKREVACKDYEINVLKSEFEKVKQEKEGIEFKIEKFDKASKDLDKLLGSQITDKKPEFKAYGFEDSNQKSNVSHILFDKETVFPVDKKVEFVKPKNLEKLVKKSIRLIVNTIKGKGWFTWVFFLASKDETSEILKNFIKEIENLVDKKVKIIRCDNGTEFKNKVMDDFCREKGINREYSVAKTPQQNSVAERRNKTLLEAARTIGFKLALSFMRPFGCHVTILNTLDSLGKFDGKSDEGTRTNESSGIQGELNAGTSTSTNESAGTQGDINAATFQGKDVTSQDCIVMPIWKDASFFDNDKSDNDSTADQQVNTASPGINTGSIELNTVDPSINTATPEDMLGANHSFEATHVEFFNDEYEPKVDLGNIPNSNAVPTTPNTRIHKDDPIENVIGDMQSSVQTRRMTKSTSKQGYLGVAYEEKTHDNLNTSLYACFLSQIEPTSIAKALSDSSWVEAMHE